MLTNLKQNTFLKSLLALVSATALAQVFNFGFNIVLSRVYLPEHFGSVSVFLSIISFITVFSVGKFDVAIVAAEDDEDSNRLFALSFWVLLVTSVVVLIGTLIAIIFKLYAEPQVIDWLWYLAPSAIFLSVFQVCWMWNVRRKAFTNISYIRMLEPVIIGVTSILLVKYKATGLLIGTLAGQLISMLVIAVVVLKSKTSNLFGYTWQDYKMVFYKYKFYPTYNVAQSFLEVFQVSSFVLLLVTFFSKATAGFYGMGMRVLQVPARLLVAPLANVFFAEASEKHRNGQDLFPLVKNTIIKTALITSPIPIVLMFFGPQIFALVFGDQWSVAGEYARILSFWTYFDLIRSPISQVAFILNKQKQILYISILSSLFFVLAFVVGGQYYKSVITTLWMISGLQSVMSIVLIFYILSISKKNHS